MGFDDRIKQPPSLPESLSVRLQRAYGELFALIEEGYSAERAVTLRVNACKTTAEHVCAELSARGIAVRPVEW